MADSTDDDDYADLENQKSVANQSQSNHDSQKFDVSHPNTLRSLSFPKVGLPKFGLPKFKQPKLKSPFKKISYLWFWLFIIMISYVCIGYFLSVLLTIPARQNLAIAGFAIVGLFPTITAFADYALMKWSYVISGFLIIGGLIFLAKLKFYLIVLAIIAWVGLTAIAFIGETLTKKRKLWIAIGILTIPCLIGLGLGCQMWRLAASWS
jgi:hypothetical protein